jgi:hypothetical protein
MASLLASPLALLSTLTGERRKDEVVGRKIVDRAGIAKEIIGTLIARSRRKLVAPADTAKETTGTPTANLVTVRTIIMNQQTAPNTQTLDSFL